MMQDWGKIEDLEEQREDILDFISELEIEATPIFICYTLEKLITILGNIINKPLEEKYKILKMDNQVFYSNIGRFNTGIKLIKFLGFESTRLENNKLAYQYSVPTSKGVHPLLLLTYDELRVALARNQGERLTFDPEESKGTDFNADELPQNGFSEDDRVPCAFCNRKFGRDRVDTH